MYDTNEIENINTNKNKTGLKNNRSLKVVATVFCLLVLACLGGLIYNTIKLNDQKNKLESDIKSTKEELAKANEVVSKYELATGTKTVESQTKETTAKEIVKPMAFDIDVAALRNKIENETSHMSGETEGGKQIEEDNIIIQFRKLSTDRRAKFLFADTQVSHEIRVKSKNSEERQNLAEGGVSVVIYYKTLPNGEWKKAVDGNGIPNCNSVPQEVKDALNWTNQRPDKSLIFCVGEGGSENYGNLDL